MKKNYLFLFLTIFFAMGAARAQQTTWKQNAASSNWNDSNNWSNGVPHQNSDVKIAYIDFDNGGQEPILNVDINIKSLTLGANKETLKVTDGATLTINQTLSIGSSGTLDIENGNLIFNKFSTIAGTVNINTGDVTATNGFKVKKSFSQKAGKVTVGSPTIPANFEMEGTAIVNLGDVDLTIYGSAILATKKLAIASGTIEVYQDFNMIGAMELNLNQADLTIQGNASFGNGSSFTSTTGPVTTGGDFKIDGGAMLTLNSADFTVAGDTNFVQGAIFNGGTGILTLHGNTQFSGGQFFDPQQSTVILDGNNLTVSNANNNTTSFYNLKITAGTSVTAKLPVVVENTMTIDGNYKQDVDSSQNIETGLNVIGQVVGAENVSTVKPYLVRLAVIDTYTLLATFNKPLLKKTVKGAYFQLKDGISGNALVLDNKTKKVDLSDNGKTVTVSFEKAIPADKDFVLVVKGDQNLYYNPLPVDPWVNYKGVTGTNGFGILDNHRKRYTENSTAVAEWTGNDDNNWKNKANWETSDGAFPNLDAGLTLRFSSTAKNALILQPGENPKVKDIENPSGQDLDVNGQHLTISGNINMSGSGRLKASTPGSTVTMEGSGNTSFSTKNGTVNNLVIDKQNSATVSLGGNLDLTGVLTLKNGILDTRGKTFTFKSTADQNAVLAPVTNGKIEGEVTVERYIPAGDEAQDEAESTGRAFRFVSFPVTTSTSINANWQEGAHNISFKGELKEFNKNPNPGYGTHITGSKTGENGLDATPSGNPSLFQFDAENQSWNAITNTNDNNIKAGTAYRLFIRGDRSVNVTKNSTTPTNTTLRTTGTLQTGVQKIGLNTLKAGDYVMIGNPYQAVVGMKNLLQNSTGLKPSFYVWDASKNTRGAYVSVSVDDSGRMSISSANAKDYSLLQPGQSFFVQIKSTEVNGKSLEFKEDDKVADTHALQVFRAGVSSSIRVDLYTDQALAKNSNSADGFLVQFSGQYANAVNDDDVQKLGNLDENLAVSSGKQFLSIEKRKLPAEEDSIQFFNNQYRAEKYVYKIKVNNLNGVEAYLKDSYLGTTTQLKNNTTTLVDFSVDPSIDASVASDRFKITYKNSTLDIPTETEQNISVYPNPVTNGQVLLQVTAQKAGTMHVFVYNLLGKQVYQHDFTDGKTKHQLQLGDLNAAVYVVKVNTDKGTSFSKKLIVR